MRRKNMKRRFLSLLICLLMIASCFTACGNKDEASDSQKAVEKLTAAINYFEENESAIPTKLTVDSSLTYEGSLSSTTEAQYDRMKKTFYEYTIYQEDGEMSTSKVYRFVTPYENKYAIIRANEYSDVSGLTEAIKEYKIVYAGSEEDVNNRWLNETYAPQNDFGRYVTSEKGQFDCSQRKVHQRG